jgi:hypothetical protein
LRYGNQLAKAETLADQWGIRLGLGEAREPIGKRGCASRGRREKDSKRVFGRN